MGSEVCYIMSSVLITIRLMTIRYRFISTITNGVVNDNKSVFLGSSHALLLWHVEANFYMANLSLGKALKNQY